MFDVTLNKVNAAEVIDRLWTTDPVTAHLIDSVIDDIILTPSRYEFEPTGHHGAFAVQVVPTKWFVLWAYAPSGDMIVIGRIANTDALGIAP